MQQTSNVKIESSAHPAQAAGAYISGILLKYPEAPILLLLGGGSSRVVLDSIDIGALSDRITVAVTDERITDDMAENNFDVLQTTKFYQNLTDVDAYCINTSVVGGPISFIPQDPDGDVADDILYDASDRHAHQFTESLKQWRADNPKGVIVALFGMGTDGHIAGVIPGIYPETEFMEKYLGDSIVEVGRDTRAGALHPIRMSLTLSFMKTIDYPCLYMVGENKRPALNRALASSTPYDEIPARIILDMKEPIIFTDLHEVI